MKRSRAFLFLSTGPRPYQLGFLVISLALLPLYRHDINPDGISYMSIAQYYLQGRWDLAVNAYWGPLISWLMVPLLALRLEPLLVNMVLNLTIGLVAVDLTYRLFHLYPMAAAWRHLTLSATILAFFLFEFAIFTPDFLLVCVLVGYFLVLFDPRYASSWRRGAGCGLLGALAYLTKGYGLYFFLAHFTLINVLMAADTSAGRPRRLVLRNLALGLAVGVGIAGAWGGVLTHKYGHPTFGTTGKYNHEIVAPGVPDHPMLYRGFMAPANDRAVCVWEDPSYIKLQDWSVFSSKQNARHQLALLRANLGVIVKLLFAFNRFAFVILLYFLFACVRPLRVALSKRHLLYPLVTLAIYPAGYALLAVQGRYLYPCLVVLNLMCGLFLDRLDRTPFFTPGRRRLAFALVLLTSLYFPTRFLFPGVREYDGIYRLSQSLAAHPELKGSNVASNREWHNSVYLSYYIGMKYYGQQGSLRTEDVPQALAAQHIRYYFVWNASAAEKQLYAGRRDLLGGAGGKLAIFDLEGGGSPDPSGAGTRATAREAG